jgi:hypothetical protein
MTAAAEPSKQDLSPVVPAGIEKEPILLLDTSGSMSWPTSDGGRVERRALVGEAMGLLVTKLGAEDSQAEEEAAAGEDAGGLMTVVFSDPSAAEVIGDLSETNWRDKWANIQWGGGTNIMPGWSLVIDNYLEEFGETPKTERPALLVLVVTDGEATDIQAFEDECAKAQGGTYICVAIVGFGPEHDRTLADYQKIAANNNHVRVVSFESETDPTVVAEALISLVS